jgi:hypothetical protein
MSDDQVDDAGFQANLDRLHDQFEEEGNSDNNINDLSNNEPLPYVPQQTQNNNSPLPEDGAMLVHAVAVAAEDDDDDDDDDDIYAAAEAAAASLEEPSSEPESRRDLSESTDVAALQSELAKKQAEVDALKKALKSRDRQLQHQASQRSTTLLIGEAVLAHNNSINSNLQSLSTITADIVDPNKITNLEDRWKARFQQLVSFKLKYGHCNVPKSFDDSLHAWVRKQRVNKQVHDQTQGKRGLSDTKLHSLQALDFEWIVGHMPKDDQWQQNYQKLVLLNQEQGHLETTLDKGLNKWMQNQRSRRKLLEQQGVGKAKGMTWERVQKLDAVGFKWDTKKM